MKIKRQQLLAVGLAAVTLAAPTAIAKGKKDSSSEGGPNGRPFQELRAQIAALEARLVELEESGLGDLADTVIPNTEAGLLLVDEIGTRILSPGDLEGSDQEPGPATIFWGPTDDCSIGIDPPGGLLGLIERDPVGFRLMGPGGQGCRLIFGPTMDCTVEVDPRGPAGLLLRDPAGVRILNPDLGAAALRFGPTDDCALWIDPTGDLTGLIESDPNGLRLLGPGGQGCILTFGPTDLCRILVNPNGPDGLTLQDPNGVRLLSSDPRGATSLRFGPTDDCALWIDPTGELSGLIESDPNGLRLLGPGGQGCILTFGPTDECRIFVDPERPGLNFSDPAGFFFDNDIFVRGEIVQVSSRDYKSNVQPIEEPLEILDKLQGVSFDWKEEFGGRADIGFIAEDVAEVLPELVAMSPDGKSAKGMKYGNLVAVAVEGIKSQQSEIESLRSDNAALRDRLNAMESQMAEVVKRFADLPKSASE